jgi:SAM-dependent methyltransferase
MTEHRYVGSELTLFSEATRWKEYIRLAVAPFMGAEVGEVGAGLGGTTRILCTGRERRWVGMEPDPTLAAELQRLAENGGLPACFEPFAGTLQDLPADARFDTLLYVDVLEHIDDDRTELSRAASRLKPGGHVVVVSPAQPWLFSPFDAAIGHHRRYTRKSLAALTPEGLEPVRTEYLDSVGLLASLGNRMLLRQSMPTAKQIEFWDRAMVPVSRRLDPLLAYRVGKAVLGAWRRPG